MINRYSFASKIPEEKITKLIKLFLMDLNTIQLKDVLDLNRNTVNRYLHAIRERIAVFCEEQSPLVGIPWQDQIFREVERQKGVKGRNPSQRNILFGIKALDGKVYTELIPDGLPKSLLFALIRGKASLPAVTSLREWRGYDAIANLTGKKLYHLPSGQAAADDLSQGKGSAISDIDRFWGMIINRFIKMRGMRRITANLHLKESEFRYNYRNTDMHGLLVEIITANPLFSS